MSWLQIRITAAEPTAVEELLLELGALSVTMTDCNDQPIFEPKFGETPLWQDTEVVGLFEADAAVPPLLNELQQQLPAAKITHEVLAEQVWERTWLEHFKPVAFANRLWVVPSAYEPPDPDAIILNLDPGMAFGTGSHATTALCLEWLAENEQWLIDKPVIDYGCGSGILAIAAVLLGANHADCNDIDPQAIEATLNNARDNHVENKLSTYLVTDASDGLADDGAALVIANILAEPLMHLAPRLRQLCGERLILSGLLEEQQDMLIERYCEAGFELVQAFNQDGWALLEMR